MGKSVSMPKMPDYTAAAKEQGVQNKETALQSSILSNPNMYTPFGNQTVSYSEPVFNEKAYNTALADYNKRLDRNNFYDTVTDESGVSSTQFNQTAYRQALEKAGKSPSKTEYMTGGGVPTIRQTLTPEAQKTLEAQQRVQLALSGLGEKGISNAYNLLSTPFVPTSTEINKTFADYGRARSDIDTSNLVDMPINAGTNAQELILQRLRPTMEQGDTSFKQALANQGLAPGTRAYDAAFRNREMGKNDLINQAALQGIGLDMSARQQGYNELMGRAGLYNSALGMDYSQALQRAQFGNQAQQQQIAQDLMLRSQPLNEIIGLMGGSQIQLPQFAGYSPTSITPAPIFGATQQQANAAMQNYGIQQSGANATTQGVTSLAMAGAMY